MEKNNNSIKQVLCVTVLLCLVCSLLVASTTVFLKSRQERNELFDMEKNILEVSGLISNSDKKAISQEHTVGFFKKRIKAALVDLRSGLFYTGDGIDVNHYSGVSAAKEPHLSVALSAREDIALIKRQEKYAKVYIVTDPQGKLSTLILPIRGYGLWSTLYGFIGIKKDLNTIQGLTFYEQKETPGLGGEVDNPRWKAQWYNKKIHDAKGHFKIKVVKVGTSSTIANKQHEIDAISGASLTSRGVNNLVNFWLGPLGFAPFLNHLKEGVISYESR